MLKRSKKHTKIVGNNMKYKKSDVVFKNDRAEVALVENDTFFISPIGYTLVKDGRKIVSVTDENGLDVQPNLIRTITALKVPMKVFKNGKKTVEEALEEAPEMAKTTVEEAQNDASNEEFEGLEKDIESPKMAKNGQKETLEMVEEPKKTKKRKSKRSTTKE
jgi:predicted RecB family endonuclease